MKIHVHTHFCVACVEPHKQHKQEVDCGVYLLFSFSLYDTTLTTHKLCVCECISASSLVNEETILQRWGLEFTFIITSIVAVYFFFQ